jgi:hypothetical protein
MAIVRVSLLLTGCIHHHTLGAEPAILGARMPAFQVRTLLGLITG